MRRLLLLLVFVVALVGASSASALGGGTASATLTGTPSPVTSGGTVAYKTTFTNGASKQLPNARLEAPAPAGFSILSVVTAGSCTSSAGDATCRFGPLPAGATVSATVIMSVPSSPGSVGSSVTWTTSDGDHDGDDLTVQATTTIAVEAPSPNAISEYVLPAGDTVSTGSTTSAANPQSTSVDVPATPTGAATSVSEENAKSPVEACGPGATCVGQISIVTVAVPAFSATDPLHLSFLLDSSELGGHLHTGDVRRLPMFHDGVMVPKCTGGSGVASPATCVSARKIIRPKHCHKGQFTVEIDVLSTTNGRWRA